MRKSMKRIYRRREEIIKGENRTARLLQDGNTNDITVMFSDGC